MDGVIEPQAQPLPWSRHSSFPRISSSDIRLPSNLQQLLQGGGGPDEEMVDIPQPSDSGCVKMEERSPQLLSGNSAEQRELESWIQAIQKVGYRPSITSPCATP